MSLVPKHIKELKPYIAGKSKKEFKRKFRDINSIKLSSNENPLGPSPKSIKRVQAHINSCNRYPDSSGFELREKLSNRYNLDINNVIIGSGSEGIMSNIMRTFLCDDDKIIYGCNIESAVYPSTLCAERVAIFSAISQGFNKFTALALITNDGAFPCGSCRQIIHEYAPDIPIYIADKSGDFITKNSSELLPFPFG